jgi:hypothetical protein
MLPSLLDQQGDPQCLASVQHEPIKSPRKKQHITLDDNSLDDGSRYSTLTEALTDGVTSATRASRVAPEPPCMVAPEPPSEKYLGRTLYLPPSLTVGAASITQSQSMATGVDPSSEEDGAKAVPTVATTGTPVRAARDAV